MSTFFLDASNWIVGIDPAHQAEAQQERAESLAAGGEAKPGRRGWVDAGGMTTPSGTWVRNFHERIPSLTYECRTWVDGAEIWTGCPNPHCAREEPHELAIAECQMPKVPEMPVISFEMTFADPGTLVIGDRIPGGELYPDDGAIHSEAQLARAMFVATAWKALRTRAELDDALYGSPTHGPDVSKYAPRIKRVVEVAWSDPAYAKEREEAERLASMTWLLRWVTPPK